MSIPHIPLISHTVRKGDNLTKIVKKYGHPGGEWKSIYNAYYNASFKADHPDPNVITPGKVFMVPRITRKRLEEIISLIWDIETWVADVTKVHSSVHAELKKLKKERTKTRKTFDKSKRQLLRAYEVRSEVAKTVDRCCAADKETNGSTGLGVAVNCIVRYSGIGPSKKDIEDLGKLYLEKAIDNEKIEKKIAGIEKSLDDHKKAMDMLTSPLKAAADYLGRNHTYFFK